ncbi:unnamed protein product, partial [marine sediment metagenome]
TEDEDNKAPTSEWAYDHWKNVSAHHAATVAGDLDHQDIANRSADDHHAKYTDAEAVFAYYTRNLELTTGIYTAQDVSNISYISLASHGGNIDIKGLDGGIYGQMIFFSRITSANIVTVYHNSGDAAAGDKIYTTTSADVTVSSYSTFYMIYIGGVWVASVIT